MRPTLRHSSPHPASAAMRRFVLGWLLMIAVAALGAAAPAGAQVAPTPSPTPAPQCTAPAKLGLSLVLDDSASMKTTDPQNLRRNGLEIGLNLMPDGAVAGSGWFHTDSGEYFPPTELAAGNRAALMSKVLLRSNGEKTDFDEAFGVGLTQLQAMPPTVDRKAFVLLTDGQHNVGGIYRDAELTAAGIPIYVIGLGLDSTARTRVSSIATGGYFEADSEASVQAAFADLMNRLLCRQSISTQSVTLAPGQSQEVPFKIEEARQGWRGVVSWARGEFNVEAIRPDGTVMTPSSILADERFDASSKLRRTLSALRPQVGDWKLRITADAKNSGKADVELRIFDAGEGTSIKKEVFSKSHIVMFPKQRRETSLAAVKGSPIHLYGQVYANLEAGISKDYQAVFSGEDELAAVQFNGLGGPWSLKLGDFSWTGPSLPAPRLAFAGPRVDVGIESANTDDVLKRRLGLRLMRVAEAQVSQQLPVPVGYAALNGAVGVNLEAGGLVGDMALWAASRVLAQAGPAVLTGGASVPLVTAAIQAQTVAQLVNEAATLVIETKRIYGSVVSASELVAALRDNLPTLIVGLVPLIQQAVAEQVGKIADGARKVVADGVKKVKDLGSQIRTVFKFANEPAAGFVPALDLTLERLRKTPSLRIAPVTRKGAAFLRRNSNRYAQNSRVVLRTLGVSDRPRRGKRLAIATVLPKGSVKGGVAFVTLTNGKGIVFERAVEVTGKVVGAKVLLPEGLGQGRWALSIGGYAKTVGQNLGAADIAGTTFQVKRSGRIVWG